jgi:gliding motility-associated-like protein
MLKYFLIFFFVFNTFISFSQNRNAMVYFNESFGIDFLNQQLLGPTGRWYSLGMSSICDEKTGKLLFYAEANGIYNTDHTLMQNGAFDTGTYFAFPMIVPMPSVEQSYYVFYTLNSSLYYAVVDAKKGVVVSKGNFLYDKVHDDIQCMSYVYKKGLWLVAHSLRGNDYYAFLVLPGGIEKIPVVSKIGSEYQTLSLNYSSHKGDKLLVCGNTGQSFSGRRERSASILNFDKRCGLFYGAQVIYRDSVAGKYRCPTGAFSPDDSKVFLDVDTDIFQYSGSLYNESVIAFKHGISDFITTVMYTGQDGNTYFIYANDQGPSFTIYRISNPNQKYPLCNMKEWTSSPIRLGSSHSYSPKQLIDNFYPRFVSDSLDFTFDNACTGYTVSFNILNDSIYDSLEWVFKDSLNASIRSAERNSVYTFSKEGDYEVKGIAYLCGRADSVVKKIAVREKVSVELGSDTFICYRGKVNLFSVNTNGSYLWSDGSTGSSLWVAGEGKYWLMVKNGDCSVADTIRVTQIPDLWTELKDEYYICDDKKELVKLDAGKDFDTYKWNPTRDTTQWIIVGNTGSYFVVVKDFRGCSGEDGTKVKRRCPVSVFYPNVFTPNNDGLNDVYLPVGTDVITYSLTIYNAWGQKVFTSDQLSRGWDGTYNGKPAPDGVYVYQSTYSGFSNKQPVSFDVKGNLTLMR